MTRYLAEALGKFALVFAGTGAIVITFFLVFVFLAVSTGAKEKGITAGIAIASPVAPCAMFAGPVSATSMNPARSLGPALVGGGLPVLWIYLTALTALTAPVAGAGAAVAACRSIHGAQCCGRSARPEV